MTKPTKEELLKVIDEYGEHRRDYGYYSPATAAGQKSKAMELGKHKWDLIEKMLDALYEDKP